MNKSSIKKYAAVLALFWLGAMTSPEFAVIAQSGEDVCALVIISSAGARVPIKAELARTEFRRRKGLMFRTKLESDRGMLFVFEEEQRLAFWMKNTYIPLSIAYIDGRGVIREIYDMRPLDDSVTYPSKSHVKYALEVNRGWFGAHGINPGCRVVLNGCVGK